MEFLKRNLKSKTFWTGISGIVTAVGSACTGAITPKDAVFAAVGCLLAMFLRDAQTAQAGK